MEMSSLMTRDKDDRFQLCVIALMYWAFAREPNADVDDMVLLLPRMKTIALELMHARIFRSTHELISLPLPESDDPGYYERLHEWEMDAVVRLQTQAYISVPPPIDAIAERMGITRPSADVPEAGQASVSDEYYDAEASEEDEQIMGPPPEEEKEEKEEIPRRKRRAISLGGEEKEKKEEAPPKKRRTMSHRIVNPSSSSSSSSEEDEEEKKEEESQSRKRHRSTDKSSSPWPSSSSILSSSSDEDDDGDGGGGDDNISRLVRKYNLPKKRRDTPIKRARPSSENDPKDTTPPSKKRRRIPPSILSPIPEQSHDSSSASEKRARAPRHEFDDLPPSSPTPPPFIYEYDGEEWVEQVLSKVDGMGTTDSHREQQPPLPPQPPPSPPPPPPRARADEGPRVTTRRAMREAGNPNYDAAGANFVALTEKLRRLPTAAHLKVKNTAEVHFFP